MPILLPPFSPPPDMPRRSFLRRIAGGAAGIALAGLPAPGAQEAPAKPAREAAWALLSDPHIAASLSEENKGFHMASNLLRVVAEILEDGASRRAYSAALVNGDLARIRGEPGDYESFLKLLDPLRASGLPIHATLGNHDDRGPFLRAAGAAAGSSPVAEKHCSVQGMDGTRWLLLDSLEKVNEVPGLLGGEQIDWVLRELDSSHLPAILFVHHNPDAQGTSLKDTARLMEGLRPRRQVKAVFFGHTHVWKRWEDEGIHMVNLPAVGYAFQAGAPTGWVRGIPRPGGLAIELRSLDGKHPDHGRPIDLAWRPDPEEARGF